MTETHVILGVHIHKRKEEAVEVQKSLTKFGQFIKTRLGLHETDGAQDAANGILLLEMTGPQDKASQLAAELNGLPGVEVQSMTFTHSE